MGFPPWVWASALTTVCGFALWKGGPSERYGAGVFYGAWVATLLVHDPNRYATQWAVLAVDGLLFVLLLLLALRSDRFWPLCMAGFELLAVITHLGRILDRTMGAWAYLTAAQIWGYLMIVTIGVGAWNRARERDQWSAAIAENSAARR